jgi:hypothetical protein
LRPTHFTNCPSTPQQASVGYLWHSAELVEGSVAME